MTYWVDIEVTARIQFLNQSQMFQNHQ